MKLSTDGNGLQVDNGSSQHVNSPKNLIAAFQTHNKTGTSNKLNKIAVSDKVNVRKLFR